VSVIQFACARRTRSIGISAICLLFACAKGSIQRLPPVPDPSQAATVTVLRGKGFVAAAVATDIKVDGWTIATLGPGQFLTFALPAGNHSVGVVTSTAAFPFEVGKQYFFRVAYGTGNMTAGVERLEEAEAKKEIAGYRRIGPDTPVAP
jgi:hypothetical protein